MKYSEHIKKLFQFLFDKFQNFQIHNDRMNLIYNPSCLKILAHLFSRLKILTKFIDNNFEKANNFGLILYDLYLQIKTQKNIVTIDALAQFAISNPGDFFHYIQLFFQNIDSLSKTPFLSLTIQNQKIPYITIEIPNIHNNDEKLTDFIPNLNQINLSSSGTLFIQITHDSEKDKFVPYDNII